VLDKERYVRPSGVAHRSRAPSWWQTQQSFAG
jgi:hypothetical protein